MPTAAIIEKVRDLHAELGETMPTPARAAEVISLRQQVETVLKEPDKVEHYTSLNDRLLLAYIGFEIDHPKLAAAMQAVMGELAAAGL